MHPQRAAQLLGSLGRLILWVALALRLVSLISTGLQQSQDAAILSTPAPIPAIGRYTVSSDGMEITFQQQNGLNNQSGWFTMSLAGGPVFPATDPSRNLYPFMLRGDALFVATNNGASILNGSPSTTTVTHYSLSPDGKMLAYVAARSNVGVGLYVLDDHGRLEWFGDFAVLDDIAWSPDGKSLAFITPYNGVYQVTVVDRQGQSLRQITTGGGQKRLPVWSPDGKSIAYLLQVDPVARVSIHATSTPDQLFPPTPDPLNLPPLYYLEVVEPDGASSRRLTPTPMPLYNVAWINHGMEIAYAVRPEAHSQHAILYAINPTTGQVRQVYPPYAITALTCPARLTRGSIGTITLSITNSGQTQASIPVTVRSGPRPFSLTGPWTDGNPQSATIEVELDQIVPATFTIQATNRIKTNVSALVSPGETFAMDEAHCVIENTLYGLPNLPFLVLMAPLTAIGMLLRLPILLQKKSRRDWGIWAVSPVLIVLLMILETLLALR